MASNISSIGVHEPEHSHPPVATHESLKSSDDQSLIRTHIENSITTDQADIHKGTQKSRSSETADQEVTSKDESIATQKSLVSPTEQILLETEVKDIIMTDEADAQVRKQRKPSSDSSDVQIISEEEFVRPDQNLMSKPRKGNKRISKRIKKEKSKDLQDPKTKLQEATVQLKPSQRELRTRKNQLSHAQDDFQEARKTQHELASVRRELEASQDDLRRTQKTHKELQKARRKLAASQGELTACKDEIFRLQPIAQTPDSRVAKEFENLCQQVVNWIETEVAIFEKTHPKDGHEHIFSMGEDKEAAQFITQHPRAGEHLAAHLIHRWLQDHLFGQKFSCLGIPAEAIQLLERAEQSMARLDPPRDSTTIAAWRSETLKALASTEECEKALIRETQDMNGRLLKDLSKTLPVLFARPETHSSFYIQILQPAVNLARTIQQSTTRYVWSLQKGILGKGTPFYRVALKNCKTVDMKTGKRLKPDSLVTADQQGVVGYVVLTSEPGLHRAKGDRQGKTLKQETFMANLNFPLGKRNKPSA